MEDEMTLGDLSQEQLEAHEAGLELIGTLRQAAWSAAKHFGQPVRLFIGTEELPPLDDEDAPRPG